MADYNINISFNDNDAGRKLDDLDKKLKTVTKPVKLDIKFPDLDKTKRNLQDIGKYAGVAATAFKTFTPIGKQFADMEGNIKVVGTSLANVGRTLGGLSVYLNPIRGMSDGFTAVAASVDGLITTTARLGFAIFGVTQSVNLLKAAFGQMFDDTVGREIRLRESILQTATTLAGTNRVLLKGVEIDDPTEKLRALEGSVNASIERIRERSLEIAGTTSEAVIGVFNIVASQIGSFGGTMKQAEDLAVKFAGALGTLGMSNPMYARQEIGSIMMGYVDQNSILAKTLGISNADIAKAKQAGQLVEFLSKKLEVFEAGQKIAAKGFAGITSNIQELQEELKRSFGSQLLDPILKRIGDFYDKVSGKDTLKTLMQTARALGQTISTTLNSAFATVSGASIFKGIDSSAIVNAANKIQDVLAKIVQFVERLFARIGPTVQTLIDNVGRSIAVLGKAFAEMAGTLARVKLDQLVVRLQAITALTPAIVAAANAYAFYLKTIENIVNTPLGRYINELKEMSKVLKDFGITGAINTVVAIQALKAQLPILAGQIKAVGAAVGTAAKTALTVIAGLYAKVASGAVTAAASVGGAMTKAFASVSGVLARIAAQIASLLVTLSNTAVILGGQWTALAAPLLNLAKGIASISVALDKAEINATEFGAKMQAAMAQAQASTASAANSVTVLGDRLKGGVVAGANTAAGAIGKLAGGILATMARMALWTAAITLVFDGIRRISEWMSDRNDQAQYKLAIDAVNNGFAEQVQRARASGQAIDSVTEALVRMRGEAIKARRDKAILEYLDLQTELAKRVKNIEAMENARVNRNRATGRGSTTPQNARRLAEERDPAFMGKIAAVKKQIDEAQAAWDKLMGKETKPTEDPQLRAQQNRQAIEDLAAFEKEARRSIEDEVYNYRRQIQDKELQLWRQQGDLRIQQIDFANRRLIEGVDSESRASLEALATWVTTKRKGELDIEAKKKEAQLAAADLERSIGKFRMNLEKQVSEIRKRIGQYEIDVLDRRLKAEQLMANIRNGAVQYDSPEGVTGDTGVKMGSTGRSTGPHWHVRGAETEAEARAIFAQGQNGILTSPRGMRRHPVTGQQSYHDGWDLSGDALKNLVLAPGYRMVDWVPNNGAMGNTVVVERIADRKRFDLGHAANPTNGWTFHQGRGATPAADFQQRYLMRLSNLEGGYGIAGSAARNPSSNARGYFQLIPDSERWLRQSGRGDIADGMLSSDFSVASRAAYQFAVLSRPAARELFAQGDTAGLDRLLNRTWTSLPGGKEAATGERLAKGNSYMQGAAVASPSGGGGAAGIDAVGGAPTKPNVTLQLDTSELDAALDRLRQVNAELIKLDEQSQALQNAEAWERFVKSLDTTSADLERINKGLTNQKISLQETAKAAAAGPLDPERLEITIRHQQTLKALEERRDLLLEKAGKVQGITAAELERSRKAINDAYAKDVKNTKEIAKNENEILSINRQIAQIKQLSADTEQMRIATLREEASMRTEAARAALGAGDYRGQRMLTAQQQVFEKYLELTKGGTEALTEPARQELQKFADQAVASAEALAAVDEELADFADRLALARDSAKIITDGYKGMISSVMAGGDIKEAVSEMGRNVAARFTEKFLDYAFKPMEQQMEQMFRGLFGVDDAEEKNTSALTKLTTAVENLTGAITGQGALPGAPTPTPPSTTPETGGLTTLPWNGNPGLLQTLPDFGGSASYQNLNYTPTNNTLPSFNWQAPEIDFSKATASFTNFNAVTKNFADGTEASAKATEGGTEKTLSSMQKFTSGLASVATAALGIVGGIQMIQEGGTSNVLGGIGSIFMSLGGALSGFAGIGGIFGRASGGPVSARTPYIVGERGPELFVPNSFGAIKPNSSLRQAMNSSLGNQVASAAVEFRFKSEVINRREYISADQLEEAMAATRRRASAEGARRGMSMTLDRLQQSPRTRSQVGLR